MYIKNEKIEFKGKESKDPFSFRFYDNFDTLKEYIESKEYGTDDNIYPKVCFGVSFERKLIDVNGREEIKVKFHYTSTYQSHSYDRVPTTESGAIDVFRTEEDFDSFKKYLYSGLIMTMKLTME